MSINKERKDAKDPTLKSPEVKTAEDFYNRLNPQDAQTVRAIVGAMENISAHDLLSPADHAFMAVYGTGGNVTKLGERPDVDILVATNCMWGEGFRSDYDDLKKRDFNDEISRSYDWVAGTIRETVEKLGYTVEVIGDLPDGYNEGVDQKSLLWLTPQDPTSGRKPIDVIYARFFVEYSDDFDAGHKKTLEEFKEEDVDYQTGAPLPRVALFESEFQVRDFLGNLPSERVALVKNLDTAGKGE